MAATPTIRYPPPHSPCQYQPGPPPLTSGPLGVHTHAFFLGCSCQLGLRSQRPRQGQQPRSPSAHQASWAWSERCRGGVRQRLELILLLKGERMARGAGGGDWGVRRGNEGVSLRWWAWVTHPQEAVQFPHGHLLGSVHSLENLLLMLRVEGTLSGLPWALAQALSVSVCLSMPLSLSLCLSVYVSACVSLSLSLCT